MNAQDLIPGLKQKILDGAKLSKRIWWRKFEVPGVSVKYACTHGQYAQGSLGMLDWIEYIPLCPTCKNTGWAQKTKLLCGRLFDVVGEIEPCPECCALTGPPPKPPIETRHTFTPMMSNPFTCECGYAEHVDLVHLPPVNPPEDSVVSFWRGPYASR